MPEESNKQPRIDVDGEEVITTALGKLLDEYPLLDGEEILFSTLGEESGMGWFPTTGAVIAEDKTDILGMTTQTCSYPFYVIYRTGVSRAAQKAFIKEFLDNLGRWLEQQPISVNGETQRLEAYPELTGTRKIIEITRQTPGYLDATNNGIEDWAILIALKYENEFEV